MKLLTSNVWVETEVRGSDGHSATGDGNWLERTRQGKAGKGRGRGGGLGRAVALGGQRGSAKGASALVAPG